VASLAHLFKAAQMLIRFISTGGTIDKIYFDALSQFEVGDSQVE